MTKHNYFTVGAHGAKTVHETTSSKFQIQRFLEVYLYRWQVFQVTVLFQCVIQIKSSGGMPNSVIFISDHAQTIRETYNCTISRPKDL